MQHSQPLLPAETAVSDVSAGTTAGRAGSITDPALGTAITVAPGFSRVELLTSGNMASPGSEFVRGGVVFAVADQAAMLALDQPGAVLQAAEVQFTRPVKVDELIVAEAHARIRHGKKRHVTVTVSQGTEKVLQGEFTACLSA
jgi:acyl-coenzyme A thioesterase PaaI-like protein